MCNVWDINALDSGDYQIKLIAEDHAGLTSEQIVNYTIVAYTPPVAPSNLSAAGTGHKAITVTWEYYGDVSLLSGFRVLRNGPSDSSYYSVKYIPTASAWSCTDTGLTILKVG